jgi:hypothetical protein
MSYVFDNNAGKTLSATLTGTTIKAQTHNRLITAWVKPTTLSAFDIHLALESASGTMAQEITSWSGGEYSGYWSPDNFTTEWEAGITPAGAGVWQLWGCYMPANSNGASLDIKSYCNATTGTGTLTGTADTGDLTELYIGYGFASPDNLICEVAIWLVANQAAADAIVPALYNGGNGKYANAIKRVATPDYYWPLVSDLAAVHGSPTLTNTGSVASSTDNPVLSGTTMPILRRDHPSRNANLRI